MAVTLESWVQGLRRSTDAIEEGSFLSNHFAVVESVAERYEDSEIDDLQTSLNKLHSQRRTALKIQEEIASIKEKQTNATEQIQAITAPSAKDSSTIELRELFAEASGLRYEVNSSEGRTVVSMVFTRVDPDAPAREFELALDVCDQPTETREWILIRVSPHIEGLLSVIEQLNSDNDLYRFARRVRALFKESVLKK